MNPRDSPTPAAARPIVPGPPDGPKPPSPSRVSVFDRHGNLLGRIIYDGAPWLPVNLIAPHAVCVDSKGDIYVGEVSWTFVGKAGVVSADAQSFQKFARI